MRLHRRGFGRAAAVAGALVVVVVAVGTATVARERPPPRTADRSEYGAAGFAEGMAVLDQTTPSLAAAPTLPPITSSTTAGPLPIRLPGSRPAPPTVTTTTVVLDPPVVLAPIDFAAAMPPITAPPNPDSWSVDENGVSVRLRMTPSAPRVGDTVEFTIEVWATIPSDACCITTLSVNQVMIYNRMHEQGPGCPVPATPREHRVSYKIMGPEVMAVPAPLTFNVHLQATRVDLCTGLPRFAGADLTATMTALTGA